MSYIASQAWVLQASKRRAFSIASEKGSSSWLSALPLKSLGYCLNKKDFRDSLLLRYNWPIPDVCRHCACGKNNSVDHALTCKKGGYVTFRHDILVETEAELLREAKCKNVYTEPSLLSTCAQLHPKGTITADGARLDIVATGLYGKNEKTFMDVRITHPNAPSNMSTPVDKLLLKNEAEKKTKYASRVINTERASFIPLVFTTAATTAPDCRENDYLGEVRQLRLEDKRTLQHTPLHSGLQKVDCKKNGRFTTSHIVNKEPVFLGTGGESGVHPRSLMLLAGDIETNPGPGRETLDTLDCGVAVGTEERLDSSRALLDTVNGESESNSVGIIVGVEERLDFNGDSLDTVRGTETTLDGDIVGLEERLDSIGLS